MAAGRPLKNVSVESVFVADPEKLRSVEFPYEKDLQEYIELNIELFCRDVLNDKYISHGREVQEIKHSRFMPRSPRVDFRVVCEGRTYLVEIKNTAAGSDNRSALGQILCYGTMLEGESDHQLVILTTRFDILTARAIEKYNLPVRYIFFSKAENMEFIETKQP